MSNNDVSQSCVLSSPAMAAARKRYAERSDQMRRSFEVDLFAAELECDGSDVDVFTPAELAAKLESAEDPPPMN